MLRPVIDELKGRLDVQLATEAHEAGRLKPTILVVASHKRLEWFRWKLPETWICSVRHGLVGKRGIEHLPDRDSARRFDSVCVGDQTTIDRYLRNRAAPQEMWLTGFPQMDPLFRRDAAPALGLDRSRPVILYAPTWNPQMSSTPFLGAEVADLILGPRVVAADGRHAGAEGASHHRDVEPGVAHDMGAGGQPRTPASRSWSRGPMSPA